MDEKLIYRDSHLVNMDEIDKNGKMRLSSLLLVVERLAENGAEYINYGKEFTRDLGYAWVVSKFEMKINRLPGYLEKIKLITFPNNNIHFIYPRTMEIRDENNNLLVEVHSYWCIIDLSTRKVVLRKDINLTPIESTDIEKIKPIVVKDTLFMEKRVVRYSDVDFNQHLNNIKYMDFISDLDYKRKKDEISKINISYIQEVKEKEILNIYKSLDDEYFSFEVDSKKVFELNIEYK